MSNVSDQCGEEIAQCTGGMEHVPDRLLEMDDGPWWLVECNACEWSGWTSAYGEAEVEGMNHEDAHASDYQKHSVSIYKNRDKSRDSR